MYKGKFQKVTEPVKKPRRGKTGMIVFYSVLGGFILAFCITLAFAMHALNDWLVRFEASQPTAKCQAVFSELFENPDWEHICSLASSASIPAGDYARYMEQKVGDEPLTYLETSAGLSGDRKYIVRCGSEKVATFTLRNAAPDADIPDWQLGTVEIFYQANLSVSIQAAPDHKVLVNGQALDDSHVIRKVTTRAEQYLPDGIYGYRRNELAVHGLLTEPEVQVLDAQGNPVELNYDPQTQCYTVVTNPPAIPQEHQQPLSAAAETYCKYMIGAATRAALRSSFDTDTDIYRTITESTTWMQNYASYELTEAQISDYYRYSEDYFSARVSLTLHVTRNDGTVKDYELDNTFFLKQEDTQWLVWEMINSNAQDPVTQVLLTYQSGNHVIHKEMVDAQSSKLTLPSVDVPAGKTFSGWFTQRVNEDGSTTMELAFAPGEDGAVTLPANTVLEPMTLYALFQ